MHTGSSFLSFSPPVPVSGSPPANLSTAQNYRGGKTKPSFPMPHRAGTHSRRTVALQVPRAQTQEAAVETSCEAHRAHSVRSPEGQQHQPQQGTNPSTVCPQSEPGQCNLSNEARVCPLQGPISPFHPGNPRDLHFQKFASTRKKAGSGTTPMLSSCSPL